MSQISSLFSLSTIKSQLSKIWITVGIGIFISLGGAGFTVLVANLTDNPIWMLAKDPAEVRSFSPYIGMLSNWGVILWTAAAAICLFSAVLLKQQKAPNAIFNFIAVSGGFSLLLGIDDLYMLHDVIFPKMFDMPEAFFYILTWTSQNQKGIMLTCTKHVNESMIKTENSSRCGFRSLCQHLSGTSLFSRFDRLTLMRLRHILPFIPRRVV